MDIHQLCPNLMNWMNGARSDHPLNQILIPLLNSGNAQGAYVPILTSFDQIISTLESAQPERLATERRDFRNARTFDDLLIVRAELVAGAKLALANVPFDFGTRGNHPQPDLILRNANLAIEVKARRLDGLKDLQSDLEAELEKIHAQVTVHIACQEPPLYMKSEDRRKIVHETLQRVRSGQNGSVSMTLNQPWAATTQVQLAVQIFQVPPLLEGQRVFIEGGWELSGHLQDIESEVVAVLTDEQKVGQAESMPTILLVDIARSGLSWIRPERIWAQMLAARLPDDTPFIGVATMVPRLDIPQVEIALAVRENISAVDQRAVQDLSQALGLTRQGSTWHG